MNRLVADYGSSSDSDGSESAPENQKKPVASEVDGRRKTIASNFNAELPDETQLITERSSLPAEPIAQSSAAEQFNQEMQELRNLLRPSPQELEHLQRYLDSAKSTVPPTNIDLQPKINSWLEWAIRNQKSINQHLLSNQTLRNPAIQSQLIQYLDLDEFDTGFSGTDEHVSNDGRVFERLAAMKQLPEEAYFDYASRVQRRRDEERNEMALRRARGDSTAEMRQSISFSSSSATR